MIDFIGKNARWLLAGFLLCLFSGFGQTYFISLSNTAIRSALSLSHSEFGLIYMIATLMSAFTLQRFGQVVDQWSVSKSALITLAGLAGACILMSLSGFSIVILIVALFGLRLFGQGFCGHVAFTASAKWFVANRGKAVSLVGLGFPVSEALLPGMGVFLLTAFGLTSLWLASGFFILVVAAPLLFVLLRQERHSKSSGGDHEEKDKSGTVVIQWRRSDVVRRPEFYLLNIAVLCPPFMVTAFFFNQAHLAEIKSWPLAAIVGSMVFFAGFQIAAKLATGWAIDKWSSRQFLPGYLIPLAIGLALPAMTSSLIAIPVMLALIGMTSGLAATLLGVLWPELFGSRYLGEIRALTYAAMVASTATSPFLTGLFIDIGLSFDIQLLGFSGFCLLASIVMFLIQPNLGRLNQSLRPINKQS